MDKYQIGDILIVDRDIKDPALICITNVIKNNIYRYTTIVGNSLLEKDKSYDFGIGSLREQTAIKVGNNLKMAKILYGF